MLIVIIHILKLETDIIKRHGYQVEFHHVTTEDGYILTIFRIFRELTTSLMSSKPVLIQHGVALNGGAFLILGKKALGFMLVDAGYDVWLGNFRGNRYSRNHSYLDNQSPTYWNFSFHELGIYDLAAEINLVTEVTKKKIIYIGFSMGATAAYVYTTTYPDQAKRQIDLFISLAPAVYVTNARIHYYIGWMWELFETTIEYIFDGQLYPRQPLPTAVYKILCFPYPIQMKICQILEMILVFGVNYDGNDPETLPVSLQYNIDSVSVKTISHYTQLGTANTFQYYDYGETKNLRIYGNSSPPHYDLSKINIDNCLIYSTNDKAATAENVERLYRSLPNHTNSHKLYKIKSDSYHHLDFVSGKQANDLIYKPIINLLRTRRTKQQNQGPRYDNVLKCNTSSAK